MNSRLVHYSLQQHLEALADVMGMLRFVERRLSHATSDHSMKDETAEDLVGLARTLSGCGRLLDVEVEEVEKLAGRVEGDAGSQVRHG